VPQTPERSLLVQWETLKRLEAEAATYPDLVEEWHRCRASVQKAEFAARQAFRGLMITWRPKPPLTTMPARHPVLLVDHAATYRDELRQLTLQLTEDALRRGDAGWFDRMAQAIRRRAQEQLPTVSKAELAFHKNRLAKRPKSLWRLAGEVAKATRGDRESLYRAFTRRQKLYKDQEAARRRQTAAAQRKGKPSL